jgi:hypothetical protein
MPERFDTGLSKIRTEIKSRLANHGLFVTLTNIETAPAEGSAASTTIDIAVKDRSASRSFANSAIEGCYVRVAGVVLLGIIDMVEEVSA